MKSEDNYFEFIKSLKSIFKKNNLKINENSLSPKRIETNKIQKGPYYLGGNYPKKENNNYSIIKDELENKNEQEIDNISTKNIYMQDNSESYKNEKDSSLQKNKSDDENIKNIKIKNEFITEFPLNLDINKCSDFLIKNSLTIDTNETEKINYNNRHLINDVEINNENEEINYWDFNLSPSKIFNTDNKYNQQNNIESQKLNENNTHIKIDKDSDENSSIIKNKEITNMNGFFNQNESINMNIENLNINNGGVSENKEFLDNNSINQKFNLLQNQNKYSKEILNFIFY